MSRLLILALFLPLAVFAAKPANLEDIKKHLQQEIKDGDVETVRETPIAGLYEVSINGFMAYMSADGSYIFQGDIIERESMRNLTKFSTLESIKDSDTIVFSPKGKAKYTLTIFTDVDCGYCRKLHNEVPKLNENGVKVRYLLFPRAGPDSGSAKKLENVWCSKNQQQALTLAKQGNALPDKKCDNPIKEHLQIGRRLGLRGTPFILTGNGSPINGFAEADRLLSILQSEANPNSSAKAKAKQKI